MVVDVENLFMCVHKETDSDNKQVYFYLFKLLRESILQLSKPSVEGPLGKPPFETPSIEKVKFIEIILMLYSHLVLLSNNFHNFSSCILYFYKMLFQFMNKLVFHSLILSITGSEKLCST